MPVALFTQFTKSLAFSHYYYYLHHHYY